MIVEMLRRIQAVIFLSFSLSMLLESPLSPPTHPHPPPCALTKAKQSLVVFLVDGR